MFIISPPVLNLLATFCLAQYQKHCILLLATVQVLLQTLISKTCSLFSCQVLPLAFHFCSISMHFPKPFYMILHQSTLNISFKPKQNTYMVFKLHAVSSQQHEHYNMDQSRRYLRCLYSTRDRSFLLAMFLSCFQATFQLTNFGTSLLRSLTLLVHFSALTIV